MCYIKTIIYYSVILKQSLCRVLLGKIKHFKNDFFKKVSMNLLNYYPASTKSAGRISSPPAFTCLKRDTSLVKALGDSYPLYISKTQ